MTDIARYDDDLVHDPEKVIAAASRAASALKKVVDQREKKLIVGGQQYLFFEDWQTLAQFYSYGVRTKDATEVEVDGIKGAYATAEVVDCRTGITVGGASAFCMRSEAQWTDKPFFQLASMAQTRAGAKALRNRMAWVAVLAGYAATPAEEMTGETAGQQEHWCALHNVAFRKQTSKSDPSKHWYSHRDGEGWCNEAKARETAPEAPRTNGKTEAKPEQASGKKDVALMDELQAMFERLHKQCTTAGLTELPTFRRPCTLSQAREAVATIQAIWDGSGVEQEALPV